MENNDHAVDAAKLQRSFIDAGLHGVAALVQYLAESSMTELGFSFVNDPEELLHQVTNAVAGVYGVTYATLAEVVTNRTGRNADRLKGIAAGISIGPIFVSVERPRIELTPLQWLETLDRVRGSIAPAALEKFNGLCANQALVLREPPGEDITHINL